MAAGIPCARYLTVAEAIADEQVTLRKLMTDVETGAETFKVANLPFQFSGSPLKAGARVADLGEHTETVLTAVRSPVSADLSNSADSRQEASHA